VALVTGSARRIGRETALALAAEGAHVVVHARNSGAEIEAVASEIREAGGSAEARLADITVEAEVTGLIASLNDRHGRIDILVNNAAVRRQTPLTGMTLAEWREITGIVLDGAFLLSRAVLPGMVERGYGRIVSIGGLSGHAGASQRAHVATAKAGIVGLTKALAVEFAGTGITANCVAPGKIGGPRSATAGSPGRFRGGESLVGHEGTPANVAEVVRMLCLPAGSYITGQTIHVNGGLFLP
jgi:3-oxoacyl-[acyl-carrier protein] reductase